jgi:hypothetical protein
MGFLDRKVDVIIREYYGIKIGKDGKNKESA